MTKVEIQKKKRIIEQKIKQIPLPYLDGWASWMGMSDKFIIKKNIRKCLKVLKFSKFCKFSKIWKISNFLKTLNFSNIFKVFDKKIKILKIFTIFDIFKNLYFSFEKFRNVYNLDIF